MVAAFLLGSLRDERQGRIGLVILVGGAAIIVLNDPAHAGSEVLLVPAVFTLAWLGGFALRERAGRRRGPRSARSQAEREREGAARIAVAEERARIARELHDIVAHAVSVMVLQVGRGPAPAARRVRRGRGRAARRRGDGPLGARRDAPPARRDAPDDDGPGLAPQPGLGRLDLLLGEIRRAGLPVRAARRRRAGPAAAWRSTSPPIASSRRG